MNNYLKQSIVLVGNIGTGKTYYSKNNFPSKYLIVRPDDFLGDLDSKLEKMLNLIETGLANNKTIVVDGLNLEKSQRIQLLYFVNKYPNYKKIIHDFGRGNQNTLRRLTVERTFKTYDQWKEIFYENYILYQKPDMNEGYDEIIEISNSFTQSRQY